MAGTIIVDRIESDASYASTINVAAQVTFSNTVSFSSATSISSNVGIGSSSPRARVDVNGSIYTSWADTNFIGMQFGSDPSSYRLGMLPISSTRDLQIQSKGADGYGVSGITFHTGTSPTERMRINSLGYVTQPYQSYAHLVYSDGTGILRNNLVPWNSNRVNRNSAYNASTKLFTAPVAGIYFVSWTNRRYDGFTAGTGDQLNIYKNGSQYMQSYYAGCFAGTVECAANDTIGFFYNNDSGTVYMKEAYASIWLLG